MYTGEYSIPWFADSPTNEFENQQAPCNTMKGGKNLNSGSSGRGFGIATSKGSGLREPINMAILKLRESGKLGKRLNRYGCPVFLSCQRSSKPNIKCIM